MKPINLKRLITAIVIPEAVGFLSTVFSGDIGKNYEQVKSPPLSPPGIVFPIVWIILYGLMGIASYLIYEENDRRSDAVREALLFYGLQLAVNFIWPIVFFGLEAYTVSIVIILVLLALAIITTLKFKKLYPASFWLMVPYILWLVFATYLNIGVAVLN